ncbi:MAG: ATP-grasp domain-containing protein [Ktedonobacteraceae bacterium]|nr:ATP-grasp domain-containing protein [Ktedonobacteraceae bacterium]
MSTSTDTQLVVPFPKVRTRNIPYEKRYDRLKAYDALILDAHLRQSLVTVRSLGRRGLHVAALEMESKAAHLPTFASRWCQESFVAPSYEQVPDRYATYLQHLLDTTNIRVLIASSDGTLDILRRYREQLEQRASIAIASESALNIAINKDRTLALAKALQIDVPAGVQIESVNDVPAALREVGLPAVVKPARSWVWGEQESARLECKLVTTPDEARGAVECALHLGKTVIIQQFLSGRCEAVNLLYAGGDFYARFAQWARRVQPPLGGTSVFRQSIAVPEDIGERAERLVRAVDLEGYSEVEFRRDATGKPYLMEINPRLSASIELAVRSGVDFPRLIFQWASGEPIDRITDYHVGGWMRYLQGDLLTTLQCISQRGRPGVTSPARAIGDFLASFLIPAHYDYFDWQDLKPGLRATIDFGRVVARRLRKSLFRK